MLQNAYFLAKIGADTTENEQHFAEILPTDRGRDGPSGAALLVDEDVVPVAELHREAGSARENTFCGC